MAADVFARALAFAAGSADDVAALQTDVAALQTDLETTKTELNTTLENTTNELTTTLEETANTLTTSLEETKAELNAELEETTQTLTTELEVKRVKIFDSNIVKYNELTDKEKMGFDISIVAPAVELTETQQASINTIVGSDTVTVMDLSEAELNNQLDNIIGGEI